MAISSSFYARTGGGSSIYDWFLFLCTRCNSSLLISRKETRSFIRKSKGKDLVTLGQTVLDIVPWGKITSECCI